MVVASRDRIGEAWGWRRIRKQVIPILILINQQTLASIFTPMQAEELKWSKPEWSSTSILC